MNAVGSRADDLGISVKSLLINEIRVRLYNDLAVIEVYSSATVKVIRNVQIPGLAVQARITASGSTYTVT